MRTVDYSDVLNGTAALAGMGSADIAQGDFTLIRTFHDRRLGKAWETHNWPDLCRTEQRTFRALWLSTNTYAVAAEVYDVPTGNYYQSLVNANTNHAPTILGVENSAFWALCQTAYTSTPWLTAVAYAVGTQVLNLADQNQYQCIVAHTSGVSFDATKFGLLTQFNRYVAADQVNANGSLATPIGEVFRATDKDPRLTTKLVDFSFWLSEVGYQFVQLRHQLSFVWLYFRIRRFVLSGSQWDSTRAYNVGEQVYFAGTGNGVTLGVGNFYTALAPTTAAQSPETTSASWALVGIPYIFRGYLIAAGYADWLAGDGQAQKAAAREGEATEYLELETDKLQRQQGQAPRLRWNS